MQSKHGLASTQNNALEWLEWRHTLRCNNTNPAFARKCCASKVRNTNGRFVRTADLYAKRSEGPVSALHVEMCMVQHLSLRGVFCVHCDWHQCPHQLNSSARQQKNQSPYPPPARLTMKGSQTGGCLGITTRALSELSPRPRSPASGRRISPPSRAHR